MNQVIKITTLTLILAISLSVANYSLAQEESGASPADERPREEEATSTPSRADELRELINQKGEDLQEILDKREAVEKDLESTRKESSSLKKAISIANYNINQLNFSIKASRLNVEKLALEIESLDEDIEAIEDSVEVRKETINKLFFELQQRDNESLLIIFLRSNSLAQSVSEIQAIEDLNNSLIIDVEQLRKFKQQLSQRLDNIQQKKNTREREKINLTYRQAIVKDQKSAKQTILQQTKNKEKNYQAQIAELEKQQESIGQEIGKIEEQLRASFDPSLLPLKRPGVFAYPVENPVVVTQNYGKTKFARRAYKTKHHNGVDFRARLGAPILAAEDGKIVAVGNNGRLQYGRFILVEHDNNFTSLYAHLSKQIVQKGDIVKRGEVIGFSGNTGYSFGSHLHFTVYWTPSVNMKRFPGAGLVPIGIDINPADYL